MGAHSLGQFAHFNVATRTRTRLEAERRVKYVKMIRARKPPEPVKIVTVMDERIGWWSRVWAWIRNALNRSRESE